jgi:hypothetical protein
MQKSESDGNNRLEDDFSNNQYNSEADGLGGSSTSSDSSDSSSYSCSTNSTSDLNLRTTTN